MYRLSHNSLKLTKLVIDLLDTTFINVPGYTGSGPQHWQSIWEQKYNNFCRVQQRDWEQPNCLEWVEQLDNFISRLCSPIILIGHSIGCLVIIRWISMKYQDSVKGSLLVAPADPQNPSFPSQAEGFKNLPLTTLPIFSTFIAISNDPYLSLEKATFLADSWGSDQIIIGNCEHINSDSNLALWPFGKIYLTNLTIKSRNIWINRTLSIM